MTDVKFTTLAKLEAERAATVQRIADLELQNSTAIQPAVVKRRRATISGQKQRLKCIERAMKNAKK